MDELTNKMIECLVEVQYVYNMTHNIFWQILSPIFTLIPPLILWAYMRQQEMSEETRNEWQNIARYTRVYMHINWHTNSRANLCRPCVCIFCRTIMWPYMLRIITHGCTLYHTLICCHITIHVFIFYIHAFILQIITLILALICTPYILQLEMNG